MEVSLNLLNAKDFRAKELKLKNPNLDGDF